SLHCACERSPATVLTRAEHLRHRNLNIVKTNLGLPAHKTGEQPRRDALGIFVDYQQANSVKARSGAHSNNEMGCRYRITDKQLDAIKPVAITLTLGSQCDTLRPP